VDWQTIGIVVSLALGIYGAGLSSVNTWMQHRDRRPRVKVSLTHALLVGGAVSIVRGASGPNSDAMLQIAATNTGTQPVTLGGYGLFLPKGGSPVLVQRAALGTGQGRPNRIALPGAHTQDRFPCELQPGQGCKVWIEVVDIARSLQQLGYDGNVELRAYYTDFSDGVYRSNLLPVNVTDWAQHEAA
jgi:hypothetical protein